MGQFDPHWDVSLQGQFGCRWPKCRIAKVLGADVRLVRSVRLFTVRFSHRRIHPRNVAV